MRTRSPPVSPCDSVAVPPASSAALTPERETGGEERQLDEIDEDEGAQRAGQHRR